MMKSFNKQVRNKVAPQPSKELEQFGIIGKLLGLLLDYLLVKPIHFFVFNFVGLFYRKGKDSVYVGMFAYTAVSIFVMFIVCKFISVIV